MKKLIWCKRGVAASIWTNTRCTREERSPATGGLHGIDHECSGLRTLRVDSVLYVWSSWYQSKAVLVVGKRPDEFRTLVGGDSQRHPPFWHESYSSSCERDQLKRKATQFVKWRRARSRRAAMAAARGGRALSPALVDNWCN